MIFFKKILIFLIYLSFYCLFSQKNSTFNNFQDKKVKKLSFFEGECIKYKFSYGKSNKKGIITAGYGKIEAQGIVKINDRDCLKLKASGNSSKLFSLFYEVNDVFESYLDTIELVSLKFSRNIHEDKYKAKQEVYFNRHLNYASCENLITKDYSKEKISNYTQDVLSALFTCRNIPNKSIALNDTTLLEIFNLEKKKILNTYFIPLKLETINTKIGKIEAIKCMIKTEKNRIFSGKKPAFVWVTNDDRHIPIKVESPIKVGSIYIEILSVENLKDN